MKLYITMDGNRGRDRIEERGGWARKSGRRDDVENRGDSGGRRKERRQER